MYDLTVFQPAYRVNKWPAYIQSILDSSPRHNVEIVFCGPNPPTFDLPNNCKFIHDAGSPARCSNIAVQHCSSDFILLGSDDAHFVPGVLDELLDFQAGFPSYDTVFPIIYGEANTWMPGEYWRLHFHPTLRLAGVPDIQMVLNVLCRKEFWIDIGGYDCQNFNTCNWGGHDLNIRMYNSGVKFHPFSKHLMMCEWDCGGKDHSPVVAAEVGDYERFKGFYTRPNLTRIEVDIDNWKNVPDVWPFGALRN